MSFSSSRNSSSDGSTTSILYGNSPQKRFVDQILRLQVRREDDQLIEGNLDLLAVGQIQKVETFFQRHDPAVQQFVGAHPLPAEVVDHQRAAIALQLHRRFADAGRSVARHFQVVHRQFAADDDRRPADADPALVDLAVVEQAAALLSSGASSWLLGSNRRMISPSTPRPAGSRCIGRMPA